MVHVTTLTPGSECAPTSGDASNLGGRVRVYYRQRSALDGGHPPAPHEELGTLRGAATTGTDLLHLIVGWCVVIACARSSSGACRGLRF